MYVVIIPSHTLSNNKVSNDQINSCGSKVYSIVRKAISLKKINEGTTRRMFCLGKVLQLNNPL